MALSTPRPGRLSGRSPLSCLRLEEQPPARGLADVIARRARGQREAAVDLLLAGAAHQVVEEAAHLAHVARLLGQALLVRIELLEHHHRQVDVVLLEAEDRRRVVHQHVRVEHEQAPRFPRHLRQDFTGSRIASRLSESQNSMNSSRRCATWMRLGTLTIICTENMGAPVWAAG